MGRRYTDDEREEIESRAYELSSNNGWSGEKSFGVARALFGGKRLIGLIGAVVLGLVVVGAFIMGAIDTIGREIELATHSCIDNLMDGEDAGEINASEGTVAYECRVCYKNDAHVVEVTDRVVTSEAVLENGCTGTYSHFEDWHWELGGKSYERLGVRVYTNGEQIHNTFVLTEGYAKTCTTDGLSDELCCSDCREVFASEVIPMSHELYTVNERKADCVNAGYTGDVYCEECNYFEAGHATEIGDHNYELMYYQRPSCYSEGYTGDLECTGCHEVKEHGEAIPMVDHSYTYYGRNPNTGKYTYICDFCRREDFRDTES